MLIIINLFRGYTAGILLFFLTVQLLTSCTPENKHHIAVPKENILLPVKRFEQDLFSQQYFDSMAVKKFRNEYGRFFDLYCGSMIQLPNLNDAVLASNLNQYTHDKYIREVFEESQKKYKETSEIIPELDDMFKHYHHYFPEKVIPQIVTYIAPFNYNVMTMDSTLGIGLDMYLGADYKYYASLELPHYMTRKFRQEYIASDCIKGWFQSEWDVPSNANDMLSNMIYQGKLLYFSQLMAPEMNDTLRIGFSAAQLKWCVENEAKIWSFFIEQKLLYSKTPGIYMKFINDGNSTNGFPKEAPAKLGCYIGWQIVQSYMESNHTVELEQLLDNNNAQNILSNSKYKPKK